MSTPTRLSFQGFEGLTNARMSGRQHDPKLSLRAAFLFQVSPPGIEWKTGRKPKMGKIGKPKKKHGPRPKMGEKWSNNGEEMGFGVILQFLGHFFPISRRGPFSIFLPIFSHFRLSARFQFYARRLTRHACSLLTLKLFLVTAGTGVFWALQAQSGKKEFEMSAWGL